MELGVKNKGGIRRLLAASGFISFLIALISLAWINVSILLKKLVLFEMFIFQLPLLGFFLGVAGLFTYKRSRLFAIWGTSLCIFILLFALLMIVMSLGINYKP